MVLNNNSANNELLIEELLDALGATDDAKEQSKILRKLADIGGDQVYEALLKLFDKTKGELRYRVFSALPAVNPIRSQNILLEVLNNDEDSDMRWVASSLLLNVATAEILDSLIQALEHKDVEVRANMALILGKIGDKRALPALARTKEYDQGKTYHGHRVRELAARAIQRIEDHEKDNSKAE